MDYLSNDKRLTVRYPLIRTKERVLVRGFFVWKRRNVMGTNYYLMSRNKELMQTCFAEKSTWGVHNEEYAVVNEPYFGYRCHLNKTSYGWRPLFQRHRAFDTFRKLEAFYREHQADLEIYDEYGEKYTWEEYFSKIFRHSKHEPKPVKWVYQVDPMFGGQKPSLHTVNCKKDEADLYIPFNHVEYEETQHRARLKFRVYERRYGKEEYWNDPDYLFDWAEGEFS